MYCILFLRISELCCVMQMRLHVRARHHHLPHLHPPLRLSLHLLTQQHNTTHHPQRLIPLLLMILAALLMVLPVTQTPLPVGGPLSKVCVCVLCVCVCVCVSCVFVGLKKREHVMCIRMVCCSVCIHLHNNVNESHRCSHCCMCVCQV